MFDVFGLGQCCIDFIGKIGKYPSADAKCEFTALVIQGGGPVASALVALSRWGLTCTCVGVIGDDRFGPMITHSLNTEGVDTKGMIIRKGKESQFAFILAEPGIGRRTIFWRRPTGQPPKSRELKYRQIGQAKILHTDGLFPEASLAAAKAAKKAGVLVSVDAGSLREGMLELCPYSDYYIASSTFAEKLVGENRPIEACYKLAEYGPQVVGVTLGDRGYVVLHNRKIIKRPAYRVKAVDTTGCGDMFHAGFIYGILKKWNIEESLDFASWSAAMVSLKMGGRSGIPSIKDWNTTKLKKE